MSRFLSKKERLALEQELSLERYARYSDRIKCILLLDSAKSPESIAEYLFLSRHSITNYLKRYQEGGIEELVCDDYHGTECRLNEMQQQELALHLEETLYQTVYAIRGHIQVTYKIKILFLPPYSPNLNLIERLWRFLKKIVLYNQYYEKFADFRGAILNFFKNIKQYKQELQSLMTLNFHTLGA